MMSDFEQEDELGTLRKVIMELDMHCQYALGQQTRPPMFSPTTARLILKIIEPALTVMKL